MHVDIDSIGRHSDVEKERRAHAGDDGRPIRCFNCAANSCVANRPSVDREKSAAGRGPNIGGPLNQSTGVNRTSDVIYIEKIFRVASAPDGAEAGANARDRREHQRTSAIVGEVDANAGLGERERGERLYGAPPLRSSAA
jgi:hypothetical protein